MRKATMGLLGLTLTAALAAGSGGLAAAGPSSGGTPVAGVGKEGPLGPPGSAQAAEAAAKNTTDDLVDPQEANRREQRQKALDLVLTGQRKVERINGADVVRVGAKEAPFSKKDQARMRAGQAVKARKVDDYVQLSRERTDKIFVILAEFGNERDPRYPDRDTDPTTPGPTTFEGPLHNRIPEPDRKDNSTVWQADYSPEHYRELYFGTGRGANSLKKYYERQSSGRYSVEGEVSNWVKVKYNEARYGRSNDNPTDANGDDPNVCASQVCANSYELVRDALDQWVVDQKALGRTAAQIKADVTEFDQQDRNDFDGDGDFNEPDGYIDHFQIVHAGGDQSDRDPQQGEDALWAHRAKAFANNGQGPAANKDGGTQIGDTGIWVADYTMQPENGGVSVFAHEYGHDLGLPDHYDTAGGDNGVEYWNLMAQSRVSAKNDIGLGTRAADLSAWDKMQLGWLDYEIAVAGQKKTYELGPHEYNSAKAQALAVVLPEKKVVTPLRTPATGTRQWWSGRGDDLDTTLSRQVTLGEGPASLNFQANWAIEDCEADPCDYAFVEVNTGAGWTAIPGNITKPAEGNGIDGDSGGWVAATFDLSTYAGTTIGLRFRYVTDGAVQGIGFFADDITVTSGGTTVFTDGAESGTGGWTADGFTSVGAELTQSFPQYYLASNRTYTSYDRYLKSGPYNFGFGPALPNKVEHFAYQPGLLVSYVDRSFADNNTSEHPGGGLVLPIDSHPDAIYRIDGVAWRSRVQVYDAPFSLRRPDSFTLHINGRASYIRGGKPQPLFDDTRSYWREDIPLTGVQTPGIGVTLEVAEQSGTSMTVELGTSKSVSSAATLASARRAAVD